MIDSYFLCRVRWFEGCVAWKGKRVRVEPGAGVVQSAGANAESEESPTTAVVLPVGYVQISLVRVQVLGFWLLGISIMELWFTQKMFVRPFRPP